MPAVDVLDSTMFYREAGAGTPKVLSASRTNPMPTEPAGQDHVSGGS